MSLRERVERQAEELRAIRDELRVRVELGKMEARDHWNDLEGRWDRVEGKLKQLADAASESAEDVAEATELVLGEIKEGYSKLRKLL